MTSGPTRSESEAAGIPRTTLKETVQRALACERAREWEQALLLYDGLPPDYPKRAAALSRLHFKCARAAMAAKHWPQAAEHYRALYRENPADEKLKKGFGIAAQKAAREAEAAGQWETAAQNWHDVRQLSGAGKTGETARLHGARCAIRAARAAEAGGGNMEAAASWALARSADPTSNAAEKGLLRTLLRAARQAEDADSYDDAIRLWGRFRALNQRSELASRALERVLARAARRCEEIGKGEYALTLWRKLLELSPDHQAAKRATQRLTKLQDPLSQSEPVEVGRGATRAGKLPSPLNSQAAANDGNPNSHLLITGRCMPRIHLRIPASSARYYKIHFTDDGFPAQRSAEGTILENPICAYYIIDEYLTQFETSHDLAALDAARLVADATWRRSKQFNNAAVLWYDGQFAPARSTHRHYSGLTQAYLARGFYRLGKAVGEMSYFEKARAYFDSLKTPAAKGGVMRSFPQGTGIEELPMDVPDLILNGWLSALAVLVENKDFVSQFDCAPFIEENFNLLEYLLPCYDVPELLNTRYSLSGFLYCRFRLPPKCRLHLRNTKVELNRRAVFPLKADSGSRWRNYAFDEDVERQPDGTLASQSRILRLNLVLSQLGDPNTLCFSARADQTCRIEIDSLLGRYSPLHSAPVKGDWTPISTIEVGPEYRDFRIPIRLPHTRLIGYPTNFMKVFDGVHRNVYHPIHVDRLVDLQAYQRRPIFEYYIKRWVDYIRLWRGTELYKAFTQVDYSSYVRVPYNKALKLPQSG